MVIESDSASVKYILPTTPAEAFSFLLAVKDVITVPDVDVCLNTGAVLIATLK